MSDRGRAWLLGFALVFPTAYTWLYFVALVGHPAARVVYGLGKLIQFTLPVVWLMLAHRGRQSGWAFSPTSSVNSPAALAAEGENIIAPHPRHGLSLGIGVGLGFGIFFAALATYRYYLSGSELLAGAPAAASARLRDFGLDSPRGFVLLALFYCLFHSALEEYYWRWFAFGQMRRVVPWGLAVGLSSFGFMAHHVLVVSAYVPSWPWAAVLSLSVAVGGALWAWLYQRTGSLLGPWLSHLLVDAALMTVGYQLLWP